MFRSPVLRCVSDWSTGDSQRGLTGTLSLVKMSTLSNKSELSEAFVPLECAATAASESDSGSP